MHIHPPGDGDAARIRDLLIASFPTAAEADLVARLEEEGHLVLSFVATIDDEIVGYVGFSRMTVVADGERVPALGLAPLAVLPAHRRRGIGGRLIQQGLAAANGRGTALVFVLGDPDFHGGFGFRAEAAAPFECSYRGPNLLAQWLSSPRTPSSGSAAYAPAFANLS